ncbi:SAE1 (predicted), partial [Pycnogonum litorale]
RLRGARVLIAGISGLGAELCKNIVLAGVNSVVLLDDKVVSEEDASCQFLVQRDDIGKNRAECSLNSTQRLNPLVGLTVDCQPLSRKKDEFYKQFDVVCVIGYSMTVACAVNDICRKHEIKFFCGDVYGYYGYFFVDLGSHTYLEESSKDKKEESETVMKKMELEYPSLETAIADFGSASQRICPSYYVFRVLMEFYETYGRHPKSSQHEDDSCILVKLRNHVLDNIGVRRNKLDDSFSRRAFAELSPVCAIVGGILSQEIIKAVSCKDKPLDNFFFFDGTNSNGTVERFGPR